MIFIINVITNLFIDNLFINCLNIKQLYIKIYNTIFDLFS